MLSISGTAGALNSTGRAEPTVSSRDLPVGPFSGATWSTAKSYGAPCPPVAAPWLIHWSEVCAHWPHHTPYGAICSLDAFCSSAVDMPVSLYEGTKAMLRYQPPFLPACTQWPAVQTMLDLPGWAGSCTTVAEQTIEPSGPSNRSFPDAGALSWYGVLRPAASTGAGVGSVTPSSPEMSLSTGFSGGLSASRIRSGSQRSSMIGLT